MDNEPLRLPEPPRAPALFNDDGTPIADQRPSRRRSGDRIGAAAIIAISIGAAAAVLFYVFG